MSFYVSHETFCLQLFTTAGTGNASEGCKELLTLGAGDAHRPRCYQRLANRQDTKIVSGEEEKNHQNLKTPHVYLTRMQRNFLSHFYSKNKAYLFVAYTCGIT